MCDAQSGVIFLYTSGDISAYKSLYLESDGL